MENKKFEVKFENNNLEISLDTNQDGQKLISIKVNLSEAMQEVIARGDKIEGAKMIEFEFSMSKLILKLDTDQDGEKLMEIEIDLTEAIDEAGIMK